MATHALQNKLYYHMTNILSSPNVAGVITCHRCTELLYFKDSLKYKKNRLRNP